MENLPSWLITQLAGTAGRLVGEKFSAAGARGYHYRVLHSLYYDGPTTQANLGRRTGIYPSDMVATLTELQAGGFTMRVLDKSDKRRYLVEITPDGKRRAEELAEKAAGIQDDLLEPLTPEQREELTKLLSILYEHHRQGFPPLPKI